MLNTFYKKIINKFHISLDVKLLFTPFPTTIDFLIYLDNIIFG